MRLTLPVLVLPMLLAGLVTISWPVAAAPPDAAAQRPLYDAEQPVSVSPDPVAAAEAATTGTGGSDAAAASDAGERTVPDWAVADDPTEQAEPSEPATVLDIVNEDDRLEAAQEEGTEPGDLEDTALLEADGDTDTADEADTAGAEGDATAAIGRDGTGEVEPGPPGHELFPTSPVIEEQKAFWIQIFVRFNSDQGLIHDGRIAMPVYDSLDLTGMSYRQQRRVIRSRKAEIAANLRELAAALAAGGQPAGAQARLLALLPDDVTPDDVRGYAANVRFQRGLADRFEQGVIRSGAVLAQMREVLAAHGVPRDLAYLPHVESSFNYKARSKYGAAGIWQFTRSTGRLFMDVSYEVDERLDPITATWAAAKFLRQNYDKLGTWPLAITAYNHGPASLKRAVQRTGRDDLGYLIENYDGRLFRFASRNFYASFLAAREVAHRYERYFGPLELHPPLRYATVELPYYVAVDDVADTLGLTVPQLHDLNPALRHPVWSGTKFIPAGYSLRIPAGRDAERFVAAVPEDARHDEQKLTSVVRVQRGDSLYSIGRRHGVPWREIAAANNISSYRRLMPGQKLIIPREGITPQPVAAQELEVVKIDPKELEARKDRLEHLLRTVSRRDTGETPQNVLSAQQFQELKVLRYDPQNRYGEIEAAYGETLGHYSDWAGATTQEIRRLNGMSYGTALRPGRSLLVPLDQVGPERFGQQRLLYHVQRMERFFAQYKIAEVVKVKVRRGQSPWDIAQNNDVPMWLFYRENPHLLKQPMQPGMQVALPVLQQIVQN